MAPNTLRSLGTSRGTRDAPRSRARTRRPIVQLIDRLRRLPYGWIVVGTLSITETVSWGIVYYGFPVFLRPMEQELGASRVAVTGAFSVGLGIAALAAIPVGRWLDRHGPRALMTAGSCLATVLLLVWSRIDSLWALYAVWSGLGFAMAAILYEPAFVAVVQWFDRGRDRAMLTLTLAAGLASTIFMPIEAWLLARLGWRATLTTLAVVLAVITIPLHAIALRPAPKPASGGGTGGAPRVIPGVTLHAASCTAVFWVLAVAFVVGNFATNSVTVHLIPYLTDRGYSAAVAAATIGWMGAMQLPGRVFFVPVARWLGPRWVTAGVFWGQAAGVGVIPFVRLLGVAPVVMLLGASNGMSTLARASVVAEVFGRRHYGAVAGALALGANGARAAAPVGASLLVIGLGSYDTLFWTFAAALAIVAGGVLATDTSPRAEMAETTTESAGR
ncbi:MAG: MFS transporter [Candidatus Rokubacteria bacterium]|nr:MFS transporter [Candidatus Rokubacteria bacterium]